VSKIVSVSFIWEIRFGVLLKSKLLKHVGQSFLRQKDRVERLIVRDAKAKDQNSAAPRNEEIFSEVFAGPGVSNLHTNESN